MPWMPKYLKKYMRSTKPYIIIDASICVLYLSNVVSVLLFVLYFGRSQYMIILYLRICEKRPSMSCKESDSYLQFLVVSCRSEPCKGMTRLKWRNQQPTSKIYRVMRYNWYNPKKHNLSHILAGKMMIFQWIWWVFPTIFRQIRLEPVAYLTHSLHPHAAHVADSFVVQNID